jgi:hypothetical protein
MRRAGGDFPHQKKRIKIASGCNFVYKLTPVFAECTHAGAGMLTFVMIF